MTEPMRDLGDRERPRLPPDAQPYDPANGLRVGALSGGLLGALSTVVGGVGLAWLVFVGGGVGAVIGYWTQKRRLDRYQQDVPAHVEDD